jgi:RNase P subunit RPR2
MRERLNQLDRTFREQGYTAAMVEEARRLAAELGIDPPSWAAPLNGHKPIERRRSDSWEYRRRKRDEQLRREWERWICRYCENPFVPSTLRERYCKDFQPGNPDYCRQMAHKRRAAEAIVRPARVTSLNPNADTGFRAPLSGDAT